MLEKNLVEDLMPQLTAIASSGNFRWVTRLELVVGSLYGLSPESLSRTFEDRFENTQFEGAIVDVTIVEPMTQIKAPGRDDLMTTTGWELLIVGIAGSKEL